MTELSGTLDGVGLPAIVRFLTGLKKTGCLCIAYHDWRGEIFFDQGQVTGASLASRHGLTALDALVQALPGGDFTFDSAVSGKASREASISLSFEALQAHLYDLASQAAGGTPRLPSLDAVAVVLDQDNSSSGSSSTDETVPLDRGTLQTLLAVDGRRSVHEIVTQRGSLDVLWQLANLVEVGLVRVTPNGSATVSAEPIAAEPTAVAATQPSPIAVEPGRDEAVRVAPVVPEPAPMTPIAAEPVRAQPIVAESAATESKQTRSTATKPIAVEPTQAEPIAARPARPQPAIARPFAADPVATPAARDHCPKLGFEDDPINAFGRPTRMHRCFAAGKPLPLSLDQQRELCLSEEFGTCPRLTMAASGLPGRGVPQPAGGAAQRRPDSGPRRPESETDDPRIVRLPLAGLPNAGERGVVVDRHAMGGVERTRFRSGAAPAHEAAPAPRPTPSNPPTPLRSRMERMNGALAEGAVAEPPATSARELDAMRSAPEFDAIRARSAREGSVISPMERRFRGIPVVVIAGGAIVLAVLAIAAYLMVPRLGDLFVDDSVDPSKMPNTSAVAAGTPIALLTGPRATAIARATATAAALSGVGTGAAGPAAAAAGASSAAATKPTSAAGAASAASVANAAPVPPQPSEPAKPVTVGAAQPAAPSGAAQPATSSIPAQPAAATLLDERFANNDRNWPSSPQSTAYLANGSYRLATRQAGQFVVVGAPIADALKDVVVNATFHKLSGPPGGGYGIIVRDQAATPQKGTSQDGRYYVLEVGDNGEVGMWRRDGDHWVELVPWQPNTAVKTDTASNELSVRAVGNRLSLTVNGTLVATKTDDTFAAGGVGVFVGGDGNQVAVDRFSIQTP